MSKLDQDLQLVYFLKVILFSHNNKMGFLLEKECKFKILIELLKLLLILQLAIFIMEIQ